MGQGSRVNGALEGQIQFTIRRWVSNTRASLPTQNAVLVGLFLPGRDPSLEGCLYLLHGFILPDVIRGGQLLRQKLFGSLKQTPIPGRRPSLFLHPSQVTDHPANLCKAAFPQPVIDAVLTHRGLVGRITDANLHSSKVLLITDVSSSVNALIQESRATGIVQGRIREGLVMKYIQQTEEVKPGDLVLTSGLGGNFPTRLIIGQVTGVRKRDVELFQEADVRPAVNFRALEMVMVLTSFEPIDFESEQ